MPYRENANVRDIMAFTPHAFVRQRPDLSVRERRLIPFQRLPYPFLPSAITGVTV